MKRLLLVAVLLVASGAPALAEEFANPSVWPVNAGRMTTAVIH